MHEEMVDDIKNKVERDCLILFRESGVDTFQELHTSSFTTVPSLYCHHHSWAIDPSLLHGPTLASALYKLIEASLREKPTADDVQ